MIVATVELLAAEEGWLQAFVSETGQDPGGLRRGLLHPPVRLGLLDFLVNNDAVILQVARAMGRSPEEIATAALRGSGR